MGLEVQDKISIQIAEHSQEVDLALMNFSSYIQAETQALSLTIVEDLDTKTLLDMDEFELSVKVEKA